MKIVTVVGARPQFIKVEPLARALAVAGCEHVLVHTGQHWDHEMSGTFFDDLDIPTPDFNLGVRGGTHGEQTGEMLTKIERMLIEVRPDRVVVLGDTNSTIAGALAASKLNISLAHVEAGLRSWNRRMPEEVNRVLTDHASDLLFAPTETAVTNLVREGVSLGMIHLTGDIMQDAFDRFHSVSSERSP